jgi:urea carboxylase-associated protein 2
MTDASAAPPGPVLWEDLIPAGCHWSGVIRRGVTLRLTDVEGGANCAALLFNFEEKTERYNMPDTLKAQHTAFMTAGNVCYSDMGRVLCSITADTAGWHDTICGLSDDALLRERYGVKRFQEHRNAMHRSAKEGLLKELGRWGLGKRDLHANLNFFGKVTADDAGGLAYQPGFSPPGACVALRCEMHVLMALSTSIHPLDPRAEYLPRPVKLTAWRSGPAPAADPCRDRCPENQRGFINTERYFAQ